MLIRQDLGRAQLMTGQMERKYSGYRIADTFDLDRDSLPRRLAKRVAGKTAHVKPVRCAFLCRPPHIPSELGKPFAREAGALKSNCHLLTGITDRLPNGASSLWQRHCCESVPPCRANKVVWLRRVKLGVRQDAAIGVGKQHFDTCRIALPERHPVWGVSKHKHREKEASHIWRWFVFI